MLSKLIASFLITLSVFLGAQLSHKYPDFSIKSINDINAQEKQNSFLRLDPAAILDLEMSSEFKHSLWSLSVNKNLRLPDIPLQRLPESENVLPPEISAKAAISATENGRILLEKNINQARPIASLTKLLTALVVLDNISPSEQIKISKAAVNTYGETGNLIVDEEISAENLLYIMLMDSSNDAAVALAEAVEGRLSDGKTFPDLMNAMAQKLGMTNSHFSDPAGLNPDNISAASDLVRLIAADLGNPLIKKILGTDETDVFSTNNLIKHHLKNTNKLLDKIPDVIGGKTGYTEEAGECMILIAEAPKKTDYFIVVLLGSDVGTRFTETQKIVEWTRQHYGW